MCAKVTLIDAGVGNLRSVQHALQFLGAEVLRTSQPEAVDRADCLVLPGVGAFGGFMQGLESRELVEPILRSVKRGVPLLGICVGMQALFDRSQENGDFPGLGLLRGKVMRLPNQPGLKIPHTGWNTFQALRPHALLNGLAESPYAYFNHSYYCAAQDEKIGLAITEYGLRFTSVVQKDNLFGVQFHPEKSQQIGLTLLANFLELAIERTA